MALLAPNGQFCFIQPNKFMNASYGKGLRHLLAENGAVKAIIDFGDSQVFSTATNYTCLLFLSRRSNQTFRYIGAHDLDDWHYTGKAVEGVISAEKITGEAWCFVVGINAPLFSRLSQMPTKLSNVAHLFVGLQTDADDVYILQEMECKGESVFCRSTATGEVHEFENSHLKRFVKGSLNIRRYYLSDLTKRLIFPYQTRSGKSTLISSKEYQKRYPLTWAYLNANRKRLAARGQGRLPRSEWYGYVYKKNHSRFDGSKLLVPSIGTGSCFAPDLEGEFYFAGSGGGGGGGHGISLLPGVDVSYHYVLGLLNARLLSWFLKLCSTPFRGGYIALNRQYIQNLPIRAIRFDDASDVALHERMVALVRYTLALHDEMPSANTTKKADLERQIAATDAEIDALVYELYGLTEEEIAIVEGRE